MGFYVNLGVIGKLVSVRLIENNPNPLESIPFSIYMAIGDVLWDSGIAEKIFDPIYSPALKNDEPSFLFDIKASNTIVLISLTVFIVLGIFTKTKRKKMDEENVDLEKKGVNNEPHSNNLNNNQ